MLYHDSNEGEAHYQSGRQNLGLEHYLDIAKRRALYFLVPFLLISVVGSFVAAIQRPIYQAKGKVLVESQEIPTDLVRPTVTETANERIQVIQQRIMTRDNLLALVNKHGMFAKERQWASTTEILEWMRERTKFELVDLSNSSANATTIAFTVSFEDENPESTMKVTNDLLTLILEEDARNRTSRAEETTRFLTRESQRLQGELIALEAQIAENKMRPQEQASADPVKMQITDLARLKEELAQKMSIYSGEHPSVKALKKKIAAMEQLVANIPAQAVAQANNGLFELQRKAVATAEGLESTNKKLEAARLGEKLERDQRSERLQVIEQPIQPQKPIKPNRRKLFAMVLALAAAAGAGTVFAAETLDTSIRYTHQLAAVANGRRIVSIPYIVTGAEVRRRGWHFGLMTGTVTVLLLCGVIGALLLGPPLDRSWVKQFWLERLTRLTN